MQFVVIICTKSMNILVNNYSLSTNIIYHMDIETINYFQSMTTFRITSSKDNFSLQEHNI